MNPRPRSQSSIDAVTSTSIGPTMPRLPRRRADAGVRRAVGVLLALTLAGGAASGVAASRIWLVAGMPDRPMSSQRSAATVTLLADSLRSAPGSPTVQTLYASPTAELPDRNALQTREGTTSANTTTPAQALARVFGQQAFDANAVRRPRAPAGLVGARAETVSAAIDKDIAALRPGDRGLFFFTGAGLADAHDAAGNALALAENTALSVQGLDAAIRHAPAATAMRFVLTQCHASGFQRLIRPSARDQRLLGRHNRCVFSAAPVDHLATDRCPGNDTDPDAGADQDYASLFFAALTGRTRAGAPLRRSPDLDGDRVVTLHEAHLHATTEGLGSDFPRSSTETYLERWQPVWLRYLDTHSEPDNAYGRTAQAMAERLRLPLKGEALVDAVATRRQMLRERLDRLDDEHRRAQEEIERLQDSLRQALVQRWPAAAHPYTAAHARFLANDLPAVHGFLISQSATFPKLVTRQERVVQLLRDSQTVQRDLTQLDKLTRLRQLARLQVQFDRHASPQARAELERLARCENTPL